MRRIFPAVALAALLAGLLPALAPAARANLTIDFDFSYDTGNFFGENPQAVTDLDDAAQFFESHLADNLTAIDPAAQSLADNGTDSWTINTFNPSAPGNSSANITVANLAIPANTIVVYVGGAATLPGTELGYGGYGGWNASGVSQTWFDTLGARGQSGAPATPATDFGPWGGSIAFSSTATWYFDPDPSTNDVPAGENDFYSVALHELGHVLGIGTAPSWQALVSGGNFTGANAEAQNGGLAVALAPGLGHWAEGTESDIFGTDTLQEAAMDPTLTVGTRKYFTALDMAGLEDVGWDVVPEPAAWPWFAATMALGAATWHRRKL